MLFGNINLLKTKKVAIVGTRSSSSYGNELSFDFAKKLSENDITIVSGLASRNRYKCSSSVE